jgi:predicted esterase
MVWMWSALLLLASCAPQETAPPIAVDAPPSAQEAAAVALAAAVDLPTFAARRKAAIALTKRRRVSVQDWLQLTRDFGGFEAVAAGVHTEVVELPVLDKVETTSIHIYVPEGYAPDTPAPLLFALHGSGGSGEQLVRSWKSIADALGMLVVAPNDPEAHGGYRFTPRERAAAMAALRWARRNFNVDEDRIHLHGASRGGHLAWDLATRAPDFWATTTMAIGAPTFIVSEGRNNLRLVGNLRDLPLRQLQGMQDDPRLIHNLQISFDRLHALGAEDARWVKFEDLGHSYRLEGVDWEKFLSNSRTALPERQLHLTASLEVPRHGLLRVVRFVRGEVEEVFPIEVNPRDWEGWDHGQKADFIQRKADQMTARVELTRSPGKVELSAEGVTRLSLWITAEMVDADGWLEVLGGKKTRKIKPKPNKRTLLLDFVERFDRRFLPLAALTVDF